MVRLIATAAGVLVLVGGFVTPARATQIPFITPPLKVDGTTVPVPGGVSTGFVGVCLQGSRNCVGTSVSQGTSSGSVTVTETSFQVAGVVCIQDEASPCGFPGDPSTGVVFTCLICGRFPDVSADPGGIGAVEICIWNNAPRDTPTSCTSIPQ